MVLSYSRALFALFTLDQTLESFLRGHVEAFAGLSRASRAPWSTTICAAPCSNARAPRFGFIRACSSSPGTITSRRGRARPAAANEKGKVERQIHYLRHAFFAARTFADVDDLNAQFRRWRDEIAHQRPASRAARSDRRRGLRAGAAAPLAAARASLRDRRDADRSSPARRRTCASTGISYSIPHTHVRRPLTLLASATTVRVVAGTEEIARHARSYDTGQTIEDEAHLAGLLAATRQANPSSARDRLRLAVPVDRHALRAPGRARRIAPGPHRAACSRCSTTTARRNSPPPSTARSTRDALGAGAIAHILETRRRQRGQKPPIPIALPDRPGVRDLDVTPHRLETYDDLTRSDPDDAE